MSLPAQPLQSDMIPASSRRQPVVLHVDDDAASLMMAEGALEDAGYEVVQAADGIEAVQQFKRHDPDLIIMDAIMPNMDGFAAIAEIRETPSGLHVPILMTTGLDDVESITRAYDEGATDFLTKPVNFFVLPHRVQYMLRSAATADELRWSQTRLDNAQRIARLGHWEWSMADDSLSWSREFGRLVGLQGIEGEGSWVEFLEQIEESERHGVRQMAEQAVLEESAFNVEFSLRCHESEQLRRMRLEAEPLPQENGECALMLGTLQDITERTDAQAQIHNLAYFDLVTGLANRAQLNEQLRYVLKMAQRTESRFGLLFLDLDHFKQVNDTLGHDAGDELLKQVAARLTRVVRESDSITRSGNDESESDLRHTVARLGGDEFVVLLGDILRPEDAARVAERIAVSIREPFSLGDSEVTVTTTIGISVYPGDGETAETLMKHADVAMYHAKEQGRNGYHFYSPGIHEKALARFSLERELKQAIEQGELSLEYQPKISMQTGDVVGVESLVRWNHPEKGRVSPGEFIPLAEETGLILPLGQWVLEQSCQQMKDWIDAGIGPFVMAVNCSAVQFTVGDMIQDIDRAIAKSGLDPRWLEVELTESLLLRDIEEGIRILQSMKEIGVQVSIDDFGTGFSSLSYLKRLPADKLKIDQSFVNDLGNDAGDAAIVSAIITLSHNLNLTVIAEGVETQGQYDLLNGYGCDEIQGYLISHPLPVESFLRWYEERANPWLPAVVGL